jgi:trigger factor
MNVSVESTGPCRKLLKVDFEQEEVLKEYEDSLAAYARQVRIKGFRPGKAPLNLVRRQYDKAILSGLDERLVARGFHELLKQHPMKVVRELKLNKTELKPELPFGVELEVEVAPEFELPEYKGIEVEARKVSIAEEAVTQAIDEYLESVGKFEDAPEGAEVRAGDMAAVDYAATVDGQPMESLSEKARQLATAEDYWVIANEAYSFLPTFGPQLVGMKPGDAKDVSVTFDDQAPIEELRGKTATFATTLKKVRVRAKPPMDQKLFDSLHVKDEAELRAMFAQELDRRAREEEDTRRTHAIVEKLIADATFDLPPSEVQEQVNSIVYDLVEQNARRGVPEQEIRESVGKITEAAQSLAVSRLRMKYIGDAIAEKEKLRVSQAEVDRVMLAHAMQAGHRDVKSWLKSIKAKETQLRNGLQSEMLRSKVMNFLKSQARYTGEGAETMEAAGQTAEKEESK